MLIRDLIEMVLRWLFPDVFETLDELEERVVYLMADIYHRRRAEHAPVMVN